MNRKEAEDFVYGSYLKAQKHQDYHAKDSVKRRPMLTRAILRDKAGTPCAVVAGSKGKGSVANMISQILKTRFRVGLMTSPHLVDLCERFRVDGQMIAEADLIRHMERIRPEIEAIVQRLPAHMCVSPMGIQADLALSYFNSMGTDFNVFECGKGAKYDDVNNVLHEYAVVNSIFLEHVRELGGTLREIASDKAHVMTGEQKCVYTAAQKPEVLDILKERAAALGTPLKVYGKDFHVEDIRYRSRGMVFDVVLGDDVYTDLRVPLLGEHQARNCALAMALCRDVLEEKSRMAQPGKYAALDPLEVREKLAALDWPGRLEVLNEDPFILLDACISPESCGGINQVLDHLGLSGVSLIVGIPDDKDYAGVVRAMRARAGSIFLTRSQNPHYVFTPGQRDVLAAEGIKARWTSSVEEALSSAAACGGPVVVLGTTSLVSEVKSLQIKKRLLDWKG